MVSRCNYNSLSWLLGGNFGNFTYSSQQFIIINQVTLCKLFNLISDIQIIYSAFIHLHFNVCYRICQIYTFFYFYSVRCNNVPYLPRQNSLDNIFHPVPSVHPKKTSLHQRLKVKMTDFKNQGSSVCLPPASGTQRNKRIGLKRVLHQITGFQACVNCSRQER